MCFSKPSYRLPLGMTMKFNHSRSILALTALLLATSSWCVGIDFFKGTLEDGLDKALEEEKLVFVDVYTTWCGPCKVMDATVFPLEEIGKFFNERFISIKLDAEDESIKGPLWSNTYSVKAFPTLLFLNPDGSEIGRGVAGYDAEGLLNLARHMIGEQQQAMDRLVELTARYEGGEREKDFVQDYLTTAQFVSAANYGNPESMELSQTIQTAFMEYFDAHSQDESALINNKDFQLIRGLTARRPKEHPVVAFVFENYEKYLEIVPEFELCYYMLEANYSTFHELIRNGDPTYTDHIDLLNTELSFARDVVAALDPEGAILEEAMRTLAPSLFYSATEDWEALIAATEAKVEAASTDSGKARAYHFASSYLGNSGIEKYKKLADEYVLKSYALDKSDPITTTSYAFLLNERGKTDAALKVLNELLSSLDVSSKYYNFRDMVDRYVDLIKNPPEETPDSSTETVPEEATDPTSET